MKYYEINFDDGSYKHGYFNSWLDATDYADSFGMDYTIDEYESKEAYEEYIESL